MDSDSDNAPVGLFASVKRLGRGIATTIKNRIELFAVEWQEERAHLIGLLLLAAAATILGSVALVMLTITLLLLAGEEHRVQAAAVITAVYGIAALGLFRLLRTKLKDWVAFPATRAELRKDCAWLDQKDSNP